MRSMPSEAWGRHLPASTRRIDPFAAAYALRAYESAVPICFVN